MITFFEFLGVFCFGAGASILSASFAKFETKDLATNGFVLLVAGMLIVVAINL